MNIAMVSTVPIFPPFGGNRVRILTLIQSLRRLGHEVDFILLPSRQMGAYDESAHRKFLPPDAFHVLSRSRIGDFKYYMRRAACVTLRRAKRAMMGTVHRFTTIDEIYYDPFTKQMKAIDQVRKFDAVFVEYVHFSKAFGAFSPTAYRILDTHDTFAHEFAPAQEAAGLRRAHCAIAIQDAEAVILRELLGPDADRVHVLSHILDVSERVQAGSTAGATFVGSSFDANIVSITYFLKDVFPLILARLPQFKLFMAGSICEDVADHPSLVKLGQVATLADAFALAPISINPITKGTGVKIKLLESLSLGIPTVSTQHGVRGVADQFRKGVICAADGDAHGFAAAVIRVFQDPALRQTMADDAFQAARIWNEQQHSAMRHLLRAVRDHAAAVALHINMAASREQPDMITKSHET